MRYRCAHCLRELVVAGDGEPEPCPDHPEGAVEGLDDEAPPPPPPPQD